MMNLLDLATVLSYIGLNLDLAFQIRRIYRTKSSRDISLIGLGIRYVAIIIILVKFLSVSDTSLIIGQILILVTFTAYFFLALHYLVKSKRC